MGTSNDCLLVSPLGQCLRDLNPDQINSCPIAPRCRDEFPPKGEELIQIVGSKKDAEGGNETLLWASTRGCPSAWDEFCHRHYAKTLRDTINSFRKLNCPNPVEDANDGVQETFRRLINAPYCPALGEFTHFWNRVTANIWRNHLRKCIAGRKNKDRQISLDGTISSDEDGREWRLSDLLDSRIAQQSIYRLNELEHVLKRKELVRRALDHLREDYRRVIELHEIEELTHEEISARMGISINNSRVILHRARVELKRLIMNNPDLRQLCE